jgi:5,10-methylene-tetrahydrofolate dehydrogenase/methenyl tetrahydrofolate cyclohydrolase
VILIGNRADSETYVQMKSNAARDIGIDFDLIKFDETIDQYQLEECLISKANDATVDGIIVQLPIPDKFDKLKVLKLIPPEKDVDGLNQLNLGALVSTKNVPYHYPCTPRAVIEIIKGMGVELQGKVVCLVGCGELVGRPLTLMLLRENATVVCCHYATVEISKHTLSADIVISAVGRAELIQSDWIRQGAIVIDVGISAITDKNTQKRKIVGDVLCNEEMLSKVKYVTPVPGGVGPMTVTMLMKATVENFIRRTNPVGPDTL